MRPVGKLGTMIRLFAAMTVTVPRALLFGAISIALAAAAVGVGGVLLGISAVFGAATKGYSVWTSAPAIVAYILFGLVVACLACAVYDVPICFHEACGT